MFVKADMHIRKGSFKNILNQNVPSQQKVDMAARFPPIRGNLVGMSRFLGLAFFD
jgi:hypothetical protein